MNEQERIELLKAVAECAPKEMGAEYSDRTYDVGDISNPACYLTGIVSFTELPDGSPLCLVSQPPYSTLDGDACFAMLDAMRDTGIQLEIRVYPQSACENRPCVIPYLDATGERFLSPPDDHFFGDTIAEAVARAFVAVFGGAK